MSASLFVTTYHIGNTQGFAVGKWFDLLDYADKDDFMQACVEFAKKELKDPDPEICFSDYDGMPRAVYSECSVDENLWDLLEYSEREQEIIVTYMDLMGVSLDTAIDKAMDDFIGEFDGFTSFGKFIATEMKEIPDDLITYINFEKLGQDYSHDYAWQDDKWFVA